MLRIEIIPKPPIEVLEQWAQYLKQSDNEFDSDTLLKAYYFDVGFILGRQIDYRLDYLNDDNTFKTLLSTSVRQNLLNAISIITKGIRCPINGDTDSFKTAYQGLLNSSN
jgi:hypothetical protein